MQENDNLEKDPLWHLLNNASEQKTKPSFSRNVIRLVEVDKKPWWNQLLRPAPVLGTLTAATACVTLIVLSQPDDTAQTAPKITHTAEERFEELASSIETDEELDSLMNPISLVVFSDTDLGDFDYYLLDF